MRFAGTDRDDDAEGWFRLGQVEVTSTILVLLLWVVTLVVWTAEPLSKPVTTHLYLAPDQVTNGQVWRLVTWPWAHNGFTLGSIIDAALFFMFGFQLERSVGRPAFAKLIAWSIVIIGVSGTVLSTVLNGSMYAIDLELLTLTVALLFIAEHPTAPFFFNIPAWVIGAVIVALEVVNDLADRHLTRLLTVVVAAALISLVARSMGLLANYERIPELRLPSFGRGRRSRGGVSAPASRGRASTSGSATDSKRSGPLWGKRKQEEAEIVQMPTMRRQPASAVVPDDVSADDLALDLLLDKISEGGLDSLTAAERQSLDDLRARRRKT